MTVVNDFTALLTGSSWAGQDVIKTPAIVTYSFETAAAPYLADAGYSAGFIASFAAFDETDKALARNALGQWGAACGLVFIEVAPGTGDITFSKADFNLTSDSADAAGFAYYPSRSISDFGDSDLAVGGDVFVNTRSTDSISILLHEIGHAIGLKHPFDDDPILNILLDNQTNTVMSYKGTPAQVLGPLDTGAALYLYGSAWRDGDNLASWSWNAATAELTQVGKPTDDTIYGTGQRDLIQGNAGADRIAGFRGDDRLDGGDGNDLLFGDAGDDRLDGGAGNDRLDSGGGNDRLDGGSGDDTLFGSISGDSLLDGGDGNDTINSGANDRVDGGSGDDTVYGGGTVDGGAGNDALNGGAGNDRFDGGSGDDMLFGGAGDDVLVGGLGDDGLYGGNGGAADTGNDTADYSAASAAVTAYLMDQVSGGQFVFAGASGGGTGSDRLFQIDNLIGSRFGDILAGSDDANDLDGGAGQDRMAGRGGSDTYHVDNALDVVVEDNVQGDDLVYSSVGFSLAGQYLERLVLTGTHDINGVGNDLKNRLSGNTGDNRLDGAAGADVLAGGSGDDLLIGGAGKDTLDGGSGVDTASYSDMTAGVSVRLKGSAATEATVGSTVQDTLRNIENLVGGSNGDSLTGDSLANGFDGGSGNDILKGGAGSDRLLGDAGDDRLAGGTGKDTLDGGSGIDTADYSDKASAVSVTLDGSTTVSVKMNGSVEDRIGNIENLIGGAGNDALTGDGLANRLEGGAGNDTLEGVGGNDRLLGGTGDDMLSGGLGRDVLSGGTGKDRFLFDAPGGSSTLDRISDFTVADDTIVLENAIFKAFSSVGAIAASAFYSGPNAHDSSDRIIYDRTTGGLFYDGNGSTPGGSVEIAELSTGLALSYKDFLIV